MRRWNDNKFVGKHQLGLSLSWLVLFLIYPHRGCPAPLYISPFTPKTHPSSVDASFPSAKFNLLPVSFCWFEPRPVPVVLSTPLLSAISPPLRFPLHCHVRSNRSSVRRPAGRGKCLVAYYLTAEGLTGSIERDGGWKRDSNSGDGGRRRGSCHCLAVAI